MKAPILTRRAVTHGAEEEGSSWAPVAALGVLIAGGVFLAYERAAGAKEEVAKAPRYDSVYRAPEGRLSDYDFTRSQR